MSARNRVEGSFMDSMHQVQARRGTSHAARASGMCASRGSCEAARSACVIRRVEIEECSCAREPGTQRDRATRAHGLGEAARAVDVSASSRSSSCGDAPRARCLHSARKSCARQPILIFVNGCAFHMFPLARALLRARCRRRRRRCHAVPPSRSASVSDTSAHFLSYPAHGVKGSTSESSRSARRP